MEQGRQEPVLLNVCIALGELALSPVRNNGKGLECSFVNNVHGRMVCGLERTLLSVLLRGEGLPSHGLLHIVGYLTANSRSPG